MIKIMLLDISRGGGGGFLKLPSCVAFSIDVTADQYCRTLKTGERCDTLLVIVCTYTKINTITVTLYY